MEGGKARRPFQSFLHRSTSSLTWQTLRVRIREEEQQLTRRELHREQEQQQISLIHSLNRSPNEKQQYSTDSTVVNGWYRQMSPMHATRSLRAGRSVARSLARSFGRSVSLLAYFRAIKSTSSLAGLLLPPSLIAPQPARQHSTAQQTANRGHPRTLPPLPLLLPLPLPLLWPSPPSHVGVRVGVPADGMQNDENGPQAAQPRPQAPAERATEPQTESAERARERRREQGQGSHPCHARPLSLPPSSLHSPGCHAMAWHGMLPSPSLGPRTCCAIYPVQPYHVTISSAYPTTTYTYSIAVNLIIRPFLQHKALQFQHFKPLNFFTTFL